MKKGSKAAKAWGAKMRRLRTGIVRRVTRRRTRKARIVRRSGAVSMARRGRRVAHRRGMMSGAGTGGLLKSALIGVGGAHLANFVPVNVPYKEEAAGALTAYMMSGKNLKSAAVGAGAVYLLKMIGTGGAAGANNLN